MLKLWRTPVLRLRMGVSGQCSAAEGVVPSFSCKDQRPYWKITIEHLSL